MEILRLEATGVDRWLTQLSELLDDAVTSGASIGFLPPLRERQAGEYWAGVRQSIAGGSRGLFVAVEDGVLLGSVQIDFEMRENGRHRAEIMKLMVNTAARRRGVGRALMRHVEGFAHEEGRTLLVLDTRAGDPSEQLYRSLGYEAAGVIPGFARSASGDLHDTVILYLRLQ